MELEFGDERRKRLVVLRANGETQSFQRRLVSRQRLQRLGERQGFLQRIRDLDERELPAQPEADQHAAPAAEEQTDVVTERRQRGGFDHSGELGRVAGRRRRERVVERCPVLEESSDRAGCQDKLAREVGWFLEIEVAHPAAYELIPDVAHPVTEQMAEPFELVHGDESLKRLGVGLFDDRRELANRRLVGAQACDRFGERSRVRWIVGEYWWSAESEAQQDTLLRSNPFTNQTTVIGEPEFLQNGLECLTVRGLKRRNRATECFFRACELADRLRFVNEIADDAGFEALVSHVASFKLLRMTWTRVLGWRAVERCVC